MTERTDTIATSPARGRRMIRALPPWAGVLPLRSIAIAVPVLCACLLTILGGQATLRQQRTVLDQAIQDHATLAGRIEQRHARVALLDDGQGDLASLTASSFITPLDHGAAIDAMHRLVRAHGLTGLDYHFKGEDRVEVATEFGPLPAWRDEIVLSLAADEESRLTGFLRDLAMATPGHIRPAKISLTRQDDSFNAEAVMRWTAAALDQAPIVDTPSHAFVPAQADAPAMPTLIAPPRLDRAQKPPPASVMPLPAIRLDGLIYKGDDSWIAWINGHAVRPGEHPTPYRIVRVEADGVFLRSPGRAATTRLSPGQTIGGTGTASPAGCDQATGKEAAPCG